MLDDPCFGLVYKDEHDTFIYRIFHRRTLSVETQFSKEELSEFTDENAEDFPNTGVHFWLMPNVTYIDEMGTVRLGDGVPLYLFTSHNISSDKVPKGTSFWETLEYFKTLEALEVQEELNSLWDSVISKISSNSNFLPKH